MKYISDLRKDQVGPGLKVISSLGTKGHVSSIECYADGFYPNTVFAVIKWDNGKESFLDMSELKIYNKVQIDETND